jgi:hypothetical protein
MNVTVRRCSSWTQFATQQWLFDSSCNLPKKGLIIAPRLAYVRRIQAASG